MATGSNTRYKPFAGLPPQASEQVTFNCMGKDKKTTIATASIAAHKTDIDSYYLIPYLYFCRNRKRMAANNGS